MKVGIIRCMQTEDYCPGTTDFMAIRNKTGAFEQVKEEIELIGFINCGGCPGKKVPLRVRELIKRGSRYYRFRLLYSKGHTHRLSLSLCETYKRACGKKCWSFCSDFGVYSLTVFCRNIAQKEKGAA